jgi:hypothetical protein
LSHLLEEATGSLYLLPLKNKYSFPAIVFAGTDSGRFLLFWSLISGSKFEERASRKLWMLSPHMASESFSCIAKRFRCKGPKNIKKI